MQKAVFLDRDGTVCEEVGYVNHIDRLRLYPWAAAAIRRLNLARLKVVVVTNQSGVARGFFPESLVLECHEKLKRELAASRAIVDGFYYCPHHPAGTVADYRIDCACRKPRLGMMERAARDLGLDISGSYVVGDKYTDVQMAQRAGARAVLVLSGYGMGEWEYHRHEWPRPPDHVAPELSSAVDWILGEQRGAAAQEPAG